MHFQCFSRSSSYLNTIYWRTGFLSTDTHYCFHHPLKMLYLFVFLVSPFYSLLLSILLQSWNMFKYLVDLLLPYLLIFWRLFFFSWLFLLVCFKVRLSIWKKICLLFHYCGLKCIDSFEHCLCRVLIVLILNRVCHSTCSNVLLCIWEAFQNVVHMVCTLLLHLFFCSCCE